VKRIIYLATAALAAMLLLAPTALAQDAVPGDDDPLSAEQNVVVVEQDMLDDVVGKPLPQQLPDEPIDEPGGPAPKSDALPNSGGVVTPSALLLPAAALLLGSGALTYVVLRRRR
jgi:hypothetical protein